MNAAEAGCFPLDLYLAGELIGFSAGLLVSLLFLGLTLRAVRLPGTPIANVALSLCALVWMIGGLSRALVEVLGITFPPGTTHWPAAVMFTGMWLWPVPVLAIWHNHSTRRWQKIGCRVLQVFGGIAAATVIASAIAPTTLPLLGLTGDMFFAWAKQAFAAYGFMLLGIGTAMLVQDRPRSRALWTAYVKILLGTFGSSLALFLHQTLGLGEQFGPMFAAASKKSAMLVLFGSFFLFARFRYADVFIRYSFRILIASGLALIFVENMQRPIWDQVAAATAVPAAAELFFSSVLATALIVCFVLADRGMMRLLSRWLFAEPNYRIASEELRHTLGRLHHETEIAAAAAHTAQTVLELKEARLLPLASLPQIPQLATVVEGQVAEISTCDLTARELPVPEVEVLVPVHSSGETSHVLAVAPGRIRRALVSHEIAFLRGIALQLGQRLDSLRIEREHVERRSREAVLLQQVTEAELRALRAQINPHFLFNSLNTVADLIVTDPARAELMTLRLSQVFRHVLTHSSRPVTSIHEEIEFVRTYLFIEEARFGDRLRVEIELAPEVAAEKIPSLILQPVVENALKHGLAPKLGPGHLRIGATARAEHVCLTVEDDGVGPAATPRRESPGVGLKNVAERLRTRYRDRATVQLQPRDAGGSLVTILIPWSPNAAEAAS
jgi:two-component system LytT family sensor kinase